MLTAVSVAERVWREAMLRSVTYAVVIWFSYYYLLLVGVWLGYAIGAPRFVPSSLRAAGLREEQFCL